MLTVLIALVVMVVGLVWLIRSERYGLKDLLILLFFMYPLLFFGRFSVTSAFMFLGRPYLGLVNFLAVWIVVFLVVAMVSGYRSSMRFGAVGCTLGLFAVLGVLSAITNDFSPEGFGSALQSMVGWGIPLLAAWCVFRTVPTTLQASEKLQQSFVLTYGLLNGGIIIASALFTTQLSALFGWERVWGTRTYGFVRGWSPMGSGISSGIFVVAAYLLCLQRVLRGRRTVFFSIVAGVCVLAILLTMARSVAVVFLLAHLLLLRGLIVRYFRKAMIAGILALVIATPGMIYMFTQYSFKRVMMVTHDLDFRIRSLQAALQMSLDSPALGHGPGLLYPWPHFPPALYSRAEIRPTGALHGMVSAREPHNVYMLVLSEHGFVGLICLGVGYCLLLKRLRYVRKLSMSVPDTRPICSVFWTMALLMGLFSLTWSSFLLYPKVALPTWILMFLALHYAASLEDEVAWTNEYAAYQSQLDNVSTEYTLAGS